MMSSTMLPEQVFAGRINYGYNALRLTIHPSVVVRFHGNIFRLETDDFQF